MNDLRRPDWQLAGDRRRELEILWRAIVDSGPDAVDLSEPEALELLGDLQELQARVCLRLRLRHLITAREQGRSRILNPSARRARPRRHVLTVAD